MPDEESLRALLASDRVTPATRAVLLARLESSAAAPVFLAAEEFATLQAACALLIPQPERAQPIELAAQIDLRLSRAEGDGWRYADLPPDGDAMRLGLRGLDESARHLHTTAFVALPFEQQTALLRAVQQGAVAGGVWDTLPPQRFFEELLVACIDIYYSHPLALAEIGFAGFADAHGWQSLGLE